MRYPSIIQKPIHGITTMTELKSIIEAAFENRTSMTPQNVSAEIKTAVWQAINLLDSGKARVAEKIDGEWQINSWLKKAVLLLFRIHDNQVIKSGDIQYYDKV